eukprot:COSAG06_NODE_3422_length_5370_cov_2.834187_4_plen_78_part_00
MNAATSRAIVGRLASEPTSRRTPKTANAGSRPPASDENDLGLAGASAALTQGTRGLMPCVILRNQLSVGGRMGVQYI